MSRTLQKEHWARGILLALLLGLIAVAFNVIARPEVSTFASPTQHCVETK